MKTIGLIGNPNCGKTTIFNGLTGAHQHIGNWPGVTVEKKEGEASLPDGETVRIVDLPGVYSLNATSEDERATLEYVLSHDADLYVNILDATTLERNLYLTILMCELKVPMVLVVTMMDVARQRNMEIELDHLSAHLGVPVIGVNANNSKDMLRLAKSLSIALKVAKIPTVRLEYGNELEQEIDILSSCTIKTAQALKVSRQWVALKTLEGDPFIRHKLEEYHDMAPEVIDGAIERVTKVLADPPDIELAEARYGIIAGLVHDVVHITRIKIYVSEWIDRFVLNRILGIPLFLAIMGVVFYLVQFVGGGMTDGFITAGNYLFTRLPNTILLHFGAPDWLIALIGSALGGALTVLVSFIPVIFFMFLCLSILEDSGYMARAAFLMDRFMRWLGLPGKSFVPMLVGFGCSVPAIMATRTLESKRDRLLTIFMIPFMSCSAKLPVYAAFGIVFSPETPGKMILALYLAGILLGVISGLVLKRTLFMGEPVHFIMELPPYHCPRPKHILLHTWERLSNFIFRAGKLIVPMMLILGVTNMVDMHGKIVDSTSDNRHETILSSVGKAITPVFEPIGVESDNWPASVAVFSGLFAKESVIGTMKGLYAQEDDSTDNANCRTMSSWFSNGFHQAFAYLLFILLYAPCIGATAVVFKEIGKLYGAIFVGYLTLLGWSVATIYHAVMVSGNYLHLTLGLGILCAMFGGFWIYGRHHRVDMI